MEKTTKRVIFVITIFISILILCFALSACTKKPEDFLAYSVVKDNTCSIMSIENKEIENLTIPQNNKSVKIIGISSYAFSNCTKLKTIIIPEGIEKIGIGAFKNCTSLTSIQLPNSIKEIESNAFENCDALSYNVYQNGEYLGNEENKYVALIRGIDKTANSFTANEQCTIIYPYALNSFSKMKQIELPYSIKHIGIGAFNDCSLIEEFTVPNLTEKINMNSFSGCDSLKKITITQNVKEIEINSSTNNCKNLTEFSVLETNRTYVSKNGVLYSKDLKTLIKYPTGKTETTFTIPSYVEKIATNAFTNCKNINTLSMSTTTQTLEKGAILNCPNLHTLKFGGTLSQWVQIDNANLGWDKDFSINKVICTDGTSNRSKA